MNGATFSITTGTIIRVVLVLAAATLLWQLRELALIVLTSIVIASAIEPAARGLMKYKVPRVLAVLVVYAMFFGTFFGIVFFLLPPVLDETSLLLASLPTYLETIGAAEAIKGDAILETRSLINNFSLADTTRDLNTLLSGLSSGNFLAAISVIFGGAISFLLIVVFSFYFAINEKGIEEFLRVMTPIKHENYVLGLWRRTQRKIGLWMQGQFLLAVLIGVLTYLGLSILGIQYALVLAVIAGIMELIPVFGPILAAIPAVAIAFVNGGPAIALVVVALFLIIQQFENHLIYPLVVTKVVGVPPILVILALLIGAKLAGILGILLAVPIVAGVQEVFNDLEKARHIPEHENG
ncbi:AI-2E family transporter [Candidatus Kaiserbacteria bacterium]|nr:MAG: AI-2E family transporter [Candidatus Kaiserbacteria bacterium]